MSKEECIRRASSYFDDGLFMSQLQRRVAIPTESQDCSSGPHMRAYLERELGGELASLGFSVRLIENPVESRLPFMIATRKEHKDLPTILIYGHADVVVGMSGWSEGLEPWRVHRRDGRIFGRGTADNKGQHTICMLAIRALIEAYGRLGFNATFLFETGEEVGSPGIYEVCRAAAPILAANALIASDGPRIAATRPTVMTGTRGVVNFALRVRLRDRQHHSGVHGGSISSASILLTNASASIVDGRGRILVPDWRPAGVPESVTRALRTLEFRSDPTSELDWGEPGLTPAERVMAWNSFEVLAIKSGNPDRPVNAIPAEAVAYCSLRYIPETNPQVVLTSLRRHLDENGFAAVQIDAPAGRLHPATRMDPDDPWVRWAAHSIGKACGREVSVIPSVGGTLPNDAFAVDLGMPTIWIPHSYAGCNQHARDEHLLDQIVREGLAAMTALYWDVGHSPGPWRDRNR